MPAPDFLDTNVAYDASHAGKQRAAQNLVRKALGGEVVTSVQVLAEFAATLLHKSFSRGRRRGCHRNS